VLGVLPIAHAAVVAAAIYGCGYGVTEVFGLRWPAPGRSWQVPQGLLIGVGGSRRLLVWGTILGPGFLTRNPYAGFGMLVLLAASVGRLPAAIVVAAVIGAAHAGGRAVSLLRDSAAAQRKTAQHETTQHDTAQHETAPRDPFALLLRSLRWRALDGIGMLVIAGAGIGMLVIAGAALVTAGHWLW
jgi:hypothetical protein